jgi:hypothetical protein
MKITFYQLKDNPNVEAIAAHKKKKFNENYWAYILQDNDPDCESGAATYDSLLDQSDSFPSFEQAVADVQHVLDQLTDDYLADRNPEYRYECYGCSRNCTYVATKANDIPEDCKYYLYKAKWERI